ncbi:MAG: hypothetical protein KHZ90_08360 [Veillonella parvula]|uniref:Uncharacterized protein n=1 Tax=Veillonella parvula TaxID=29466 RepID=A0A942WQV7_VEIPA|nr:hypothetical protein [Veillonella parvula]MBS4893773.1 hypothetical protein [Veillonella parvula]
MSAINDFIILGAFYVLLLSIQCIIEGMCDIAEKEKGGIIGTILGVVGFIFCLYVIILKWG